MEANLTFAGQLGLGRGCLINSALMLYAAESGRALLRAHLEQVLDSSEQQRYELRLELRNGFVRHVRLNTTRAHSAQGVVCSVVLLLPMYRPGSTLKKNWSSCMTSWNNGSKCAR